ncbi:S9 family peptidase [Parvularcula maris]|uniref:Prolyl oligopeptidase family serine peptidase n=1 Tax=Parvularcula maris TaxID=2965077 RepID=A0A9X2LAQ0_9PROT|nr:prolyl oligopeptidase family serine peptidase [Parvularcula maris]MCQ8186058.1 prolyl oligopeptidase family serine peptidase [Parvularcula maris]
MLRLAVSLLALSAPLSAAAQETGYRLPPQQVADIVTRAPAPSVSLSPDGGTMLLMEREALPPVSELGKPMERLAGMRLDAATNDVFNPRNVVGLSLQDVESGEVRKVSLPAEADLSDFQWSPDGRYAAFSNTKADGMSLYVLDVERGRAREVLKKDVNFIFQEPRWLPGGQLLVMMLPEGRGTMPEEPRTPRGPAIQVAAGGEEAQTRTYQDLLKNPYDEEVYRWLTTSQPVVIDPNGRRKTVIGEPRIYTSVAPSPDGEYFLMEWLDGEFSYQVPWYRFGSKSVVTDKRGREVAVVAEQPLADALPVQGVVTGRRSLEWHPTLEATLLFAEAQDGGDPRTETDLRDILYALPAPFTGKPEEVARFEDRYSGFLGIEGSDDLMAYDYDRDTREIRISLADVEDGDETQLVNIRNYQDAYADIGTPLTTLSEGGYSVAKVTGGHVFLTGQGASPDGNRPFLSRMNLESFETEELWRNSGESYESVVDLVSEDGSSFVTYYEDPETPGNYRLHENGEAVFLTEFEDPHPELTGLKRELISYEREDGVQLNATLYLPPDYEAGEKLPVVVWAYPFEYNDAGTAGQVRDSKYRFTRIGGYSHLFFLTQGYAVMDRTAMPVVGADPETVNDTFIEQIVASAQAAVDETVKRGFGDGERVGVGGHSYGAFMTAHLLAQSDIFRAGIARSGAYNRTLTPFGFQAERRIFWDTPETYYKLSPFMAANKVNEPMLLIHGMKDNNSGTFPQQSERMFAAVKGTGGTAKLVMLPHESHGYRGQESVLHTLAEMIEWFDTYVKPEEEVAQAGGASGAGE